jgi:hypothetical protein
LPNNCSAAFTRDRLKIAIHQSSEGDCSTVPRSPLKRGNGGTVWPVLSHCSEKIVGTVSERRNS